MTRIIIFGDLHANWEALLALQQAEPAPDAVFCLGDVVGYGPDPKACLDAVRASVPHVIGGWHDRAVGGPAPWPGQPAPRPAPSWDRDGTRASASQGGLGNPGGDEAELLEATWAHTRAMLSAEDRGYLAALPAELTVEVAGARFHLTRLAPDGLETETRMLITMPQARLRELFGHVEADFILLGGPHVPALRQIDGRLIVCPGSLGLPRYGVPDPTFAAWQPALGSSGDGRVQVHHLHYHPEDTVRKLSLLPLSPEHVLRLQSILRTGGLE
jgi:predicted phosphodiesterase